MALKMSKKSWTTGKAKTPESNKSVEKTMKDRNEAHILRHV
jgi:hypothetical protein